MAQIRPFAGIHYAKSKASELSSLIAPPYDVLDEAQKAALVAKHPNNIVHIDLPWMPPKTVGPDEVYDKANVLLQAWLSAGVLTRDPRPALYPYTQTYDHNGKTYHRRGFIGLVQLSPFGEEVMPHEKTYQGPIEDRLKLMRASRAQLSPIFGLFSDPRSEVNNLLYRNAGKPFLSATMDGVKNDLWSVIDAEIETQVIDFIKHKPIYIADGHHRYTTALAYQKEQMEIAGGKLPPKHPANFCMFVLVGMQDDGLLILPTHRLIGGLENFDFATFRAAIAANFDVAETPWMPENFDQLTRDEKNRDPHVFGLYDGKTRKLYTLRLKNLDVLKPLEPHHSDSWRKLDVAILQRYLIEEILQPKFGGGKELVKGYTADAATIAKDVDGGKYQVALLLRSTPLHALEDLGKTGEVMPQKSTYFFPKLATGMMINSLT